MRFINNNWFAILVITIVLGLGALIFSAASSEAEFKEARMAEIVDCKIVGDAVDRTRSTWLVRKIYECPDGMLRIR